MNTLLTELYYFETEHAHLDYSRYPEYRESLAKAEALWDRAELPPAFFHLLDTANRISFAHGFRLGLRLARWAEMRRRFRLAEGTEVVPPPGGLLSREGT